MFVFLFPVIQLLESLEALLQQGTVNITKVEFPVIQLLESLEVYRDPTAISGFVQNMFPVIQLLESLEVFRYRGGTELLHVSSNSAFRKLGRQQQQDWDALYFQVSSNSAFRKLGRAPI